MQRLCPFPNLETFSGQLICWIGGYDDPGKDNYQQAFLLFKESIECLGKSSDELKVIVQLHPKALANGQSFEQQVIENNSLFFISPLPSIEAWASADLVCTYNSSVGFDAILCHKKVNFFIPEGDFYTNLEIDQGFADRVSRPVDFQDPTLPSIQTMQAIDLYSSLGIPKDSLTIFLKLFN